MRFRLLTGRLRPGDDGARRRREAGEAVLATLEAALREGDYLECVRTQPGYMNDLAPYPPNAAPGAGRSTYDAQ